MSDDDNQLLDAVLALVKGQQLQTIEEAADQFVDKDA